MKFYEILETVFSRISRFIVGSLIKLLKSLFFEIKSIKADEFSSTLSNEFDSAASSYKAKEYLLAEVLENLLFLLNLLPLKCKWINYKLRFN